MNSPGLVNRLVQVLNAEKESLIQQRAQFDRQKREFTDRKRLPRQVVNMNELIHLNVGGQIIVTHRATLTKFPDSILAKTFDGSYGGVLTRDSNGNYFLDYNPVLFNHLLDQLRILKSNDTPVFRSPLSASLAKPFHQMLKDFGLPVPLKTDSDVVALNVGGERIVTLRKTLTGVPGSELALLASDSKEVKRDHFGRPFLDFNPSDFRHLLEQLRQGKTITSDGLEPPKNGSRSAFQAMVKALGIRSN